MVPDNIVLGKDVRILIIITPIYKNNKIRLYIIKKYYENINEKFFLKII